MLACALREVTSRARPRELATSFGRPVGRVGAAARIGYVDDVIAASFWPRCGVNMCQKIRRQLIAVAGRGESRNLVIMSIRSKKLAASALSIALFATGASAATLTGVQGPVMVNPGTGYYMAVGPVELKAGDLVMVGPGGSAQMSFPDGCNAPLAPGSVTAVKPSSPCAAQAENAKQGQTAQQTAQQAPEQPGQPGAGEGPPANPGAPAVAGAGGLGSGTLVIGAVVVAGGIGAAAALGGGSSSGSSKPASP